MSRHPWVAHVTDSAARRHPVASAIGKLAVAMGHAFRGRAPLLVAAVVCANSAVALSFPTPVNVSQSPTPTEKAKDVRLAYQDGPAFKKPWVFAYGDGDGNGIDGRENVYVQTSFGDWRCTMNDRDPCRVTPGQAPPQ